MGGVRACLGAPGDIAVSGQGAWWNFKTKATIKCKSTRRTVTRRSSPATCARMEPDRWSEGPMGRATENSLERHLCFISNPQPIIPFWVSRMTWRVCGGLRTSFWSELPPPTMWFPETELSSKTSAHLPAGFAYLPGAIYLKREQNFSHCHSCMAASKCIILSPLPWNTTTFLS